MDNYHSAKKNLLHVLMTFDSSRLEMMHKELTLIQGHLSSWRINKDLPPEYYSAVDDYNDLSKNVQLSGLGSIDAARKKDDGHTIVLEGIYEHIDEINTAHEVIEDRLAKIKDIRSCEQFKAAELYRQAFLNS
mgnify:CR=1 FL=1